MPHVILSVPCLVRCTSRFSRVMPMILYILACCEILLLCLVRLEMWGYNQNIHIYVFKSIGRYGVSIYRVDLDLFLLAVPFYTTIGVGSLHLHYIVPLLSGPWKYGLISMNCWICDYLGGWTVNWYPWLSWIFLALLMLHFLWWGTPVWFHGFYTMFSILWKHI